MIQKIGIIGAGQMGSGIAEVCATYGYETTLVDIDEAQLQKAKSLIASHLTRRIQKAEMDESQKNAIESRLLYSSDFNSFQDADVVIEAVSEKIDLKTQILQKVASLLHKKEALILSNTSSISITYLAGLTDRPDRFMGMHFMNPVPVMKLVELIRGLQTSDETYNTVQKLAESLQKQTALSSDFPGFIVNRILMPMINEAVYTLYEGIANVESIDTAMKLGTNQPMGPLALADLIGLDTCLAIMRVLFDGFSDSKYRPCPLLVKYVEAGWLGRKTKKGFYNYN
jgi:3-hydroxybutyryl-CoA dehydrogenase